MSDRVKSYAAHSPTSRLGLFAFNRRSQRPDDVVIVIIDMASLKGEAAA